MSETINFTDVSSEPETVVPLSFTERFVQYNPADLKQEFTMALNELTTRLQTGDGAKLLGNDLMKKFRTDENQIRARMNGDFRLVVMGDFKRGKSTLVNALLQMTVATTNVTPETVTINEIVFGHELEAVACLNDGGRVALAEHELTADFLMPLVEDLEAKKKPVNHLEIKAPVEWLRGIQLVDTPGMGDVLNRFDAQVQDYLQKADAIIFLVSALSPLSETEETFLRMSLKPADFSKLIFIVNMLDFARTDEESNKVLNLIENKVGKIFPNAQVYGISALDEICRLQNLPRPNVARAPELERNFQEFRTNLQQSVLLDRDLIQLDRVCELLKRTIGEVEQSSNLLRGAMQQDNAKLSQAVADLSDDNSELSRNVASHKRQMRDEINNLGVDANNWMNEFLNRIESETAARLTDFKIEDVQKHFQFFLIDSIREALTSCVESHTDEVINSANRAKAAIDNDSDKVTQINFQSQKVSAATASGTAFGQLDKAAAVFQILGISPVADLLKIGGKLFLKKSQGENELKHFQEHLQKSLPELRQSISEEVRQTYSNIASKLEQEIEKGYQQERTASLAAIERAQSVKSSGEMQFANTEPIFDEMSELFKETRAAINQLENKIFPTMPETVVIY